MRTETQKWCAVCGSTSGRIERHHIVPRSRGGPDTDDNLVPLCHSCHQGHHMVGGKRITFAYDGYHELCWSIDRDRHGKCVLEDPNRDEPCPDPMTDEDGELLNDLRLDIAGRTQTANMCVWLNSLALSAAHSTFSARYGADSKRHLREWAASLEPPIVGSTFDKMCDTSALPDTDEVAVMPLSMRHRLYRAMLAGADFESALADAQVLTPRAFERQHNL